MFVAEGMVTGGNILCVGSAVNFKVTRHKCFAKMTCWDDICDKLRFK